MKTGEVLKWLGIPSKSRAFATAGFVLLSLFGAGCKPSDESASALPTPPPPYFKTQFQDESQYIVETIATDLAEQIYYAKNHRLPDAGKFSMHAVEQPESRFRHPIYNLTVDYGDGQTPLQQKVDIHGPIWDAACYKGLASALADEMQLAKPAPAAASSDTALLQTLTDGEARTIEVQNEEVSKALAANFIEPALHEKAALILGAFALRDYAGAFCEIRGPLCRMTAHLCMSQLLDGGGPAGIDAQVANIMLLTLVNDQTTALTAMDALHSDDPAVKAWVRALRARATYDYRELSGLQTATPVERQAWFVASCASADPDGTWNSLSAIEKTIPDFIRIGQIFASSVDDGHQFLAIAIKAEFSEIGPIYQLSQGKTLKSEDLVSALNAMPERCFSTGTDGTTEVDVIGWGQWANFFQRHLCNVVKQDFDFMENGWGVPDDAAKFRASADNAFGGLRLYPFVRRFGSTDTYYYHSAVDDAFKVTVETPQLVPEECWNRLNYAPSFTGMYRPVNPHINEWNKHNPPPGTVDTIDTRLEQFSLISRPDTDKVLAGLHAQAPYDYGLAYCILSRTNGGHPTAEQAESLLHEVLPFNCNAMNFAAQLEKDNPARYEQLMSSAASLNPYYYIPLAQYFDYRQNTVKAATYYEKASQLTDSVTGASCSLWLVSYYLKKGDKVKAQAVADNGGEVYSYIGLEAEAYYHEATGDDVGALDWYQKLAQRYDDGNGPLLGYYFRYKNRTGNGQFDSQFQSAIGDAFPAGLEKAAIGDFSGPPIDGVHIMSDSDCLKAAGMHVGDVIVAVSGVRVHNFKQYRYAREFSPDESLDLIEWNGAYREIKASAPGHLFGADFRDYTPGK